MIYAWINGGLVKAEKLLQISRLGTSCWVYSTNSDSAKFYNACANNWFGAPYKDLPAELKTALLLEGVFIKE